MCSILMVVLNTCLQLGLKEGDDGRRDEAADPAAVDAQNGDEFPRRRRRLWHRLVGSGGRAAVAVHGRSGIRESRKRLLLYFSRCPPWILCSESAGSGELYIKPETVKSSMNE